MTLTHYDQYIPILNVLWYKNFHAAKDGANEAMPRRSLELVKFPSLADNSGWLHCGFPVKSGDL